MMVADTNYLVAYVFWGDTYRPEGQSHQSAVSPLPTGTYRIVDGTLYWIVCEAMAGRKYRKVG